ncbi:MAG: uracil-DNA glycosylase family protein [Gilvibacter sp.]
MTALKHQISTCTVCASFFDHSPKPVVSFNTESKVLIVGQAPGRIVHNTGIPWDDKSGQNLRAWMGVSPDCFYDANNFALIPMGFCFPGTGSSGDLPPRKECAPLWHPQILQQIQRVKLIVLIGGYAQGYYLKSDQNKTLTARVKDFKTYLPDYFVLPHPSPRNNIWQAKNPWFKEEVLPSLKKQISKALNS